MSIVSSTYLYVYLHSILLPQHIFDTFYRSINQKQIVAAISCQNAHGLKKKMIKSKRETRSSEYAYFGSLRSEAKPKENQSCVFQESRHNPKRSWSNKNEKDLLLTNIGVRLTLGWSGKLCAWWLKRWCEAGQWYPTINNKKENHFISCISSRIL